MTLHPSRRLAFRGNEIIAKQWNYHKDYGFLVLDNDRVLWYSTDGLTVIRQIQLPCTPINAVLVEFSKLFRSPQGPTTGRLSIAVHLCNGDLHIYMECGEFYEIRLPLGVEMIIPLTGGLIIPCKQTAEYCYYWMKHPLAPLSSAQMDNRYNYTNCLIFLIAIAYHSM